jgi:type IV pilus assembly protein PilE
MNFTDRRLSIDIDISHLHDALMKKGIAVNRHHFKTPSNANCHGFTLIELLVVVAIIGILASIALPSYRNYVIKSKRSAVQAYMLDIASREKQYILDSRVYTGDKSNLGIAADPPEVAPNYEVTIGSITSSSFLITAAPEGNQTVDGTLTLSSTGEKTPADKW